MVIGRFEEIDIEFPAAFYDSLDDEAPLFAEGPFDAPNWQGAIVLCIQGGDLTEVYYLGGDWWEAIRTVSRAIWDWHKDSPRQVETRLRRAGFDLDYDEHGLYQFGRVVFLPRGEDIAFYSTRDGGVGLLIPDGDSPFSGWALREPAPEDVKRAILEPLVKVYF